MSKEWSPTSSGNGPMSSREGFPPPPPPIRTMQEPRDATAFQQSNNHRRAAATLWEYYVQTVQRHKTPLLMWESMLDRLLWWYPGQGDSSSTWRQVLWSLAELQHVALDLALQPPANDGQGLTLRLENAGSLADRDSTSSSSTALRLTLTVLHNLWPVLYHQLQHQSSSSRRRHTAYWQLQVERVRFLCRLALLFPHWWRHLTTNATLASVPPGILQHGGLWLPGTVSSVVPSVQSEAQRLACWHYVGRRTGRKVLQRGGQEVVRSNTGATSLRMIVGELLHILRPLFWAHCQYRDAVHDNNGSNSGGRNRNNSALWKSWLASLGLDVASLLCLQNHHQGNQATAQELQRRGMRLLLHLLRSPCHDRVTQPVTDKIHALLARVPLLGNLLSAYLQDWLYYWTVYRLEE